MKDKLSKALTIIVLLTFVFLVDYARVVDCGYPEFYKCKNYLEHYGFD